MLSNTALPAEMAAMGEERGRESDFSSEHREIKQLHHLPGLVSVILELQRRPTVEVAGHLCTTGAATKRRCAPIRVKMVSLAKKRALTL